MILELTHRHSQPHALREFGWRSNIVAADFVQQSTVADAQQLRRPFAIPSGPPESAADSNDLCLVTKTAER
jgi:hypothetical protein